MSQTCAHCGRTRERMGGSLTSGGFTSHLCHDDEHDCYTLVTNSLYGHPMPCLCGITTPAEHIAGEGKPKWDWELPLTSDWLDTVITVSPEEFAAMTEDRPARVLPGLRRLFERMNRWRWGDR